MHKKEGRKRNRREMNDRDEFRVVGGRKSEKDEGRERRKLGTENKNRSWKEEREGGT